MRSALYLDTSAVLRAVLESGTTPEIEKRIGDAGTLITSRLALVEAGRAFHRIRARGGVSEEQLADAGRELDALWALVSVALDSLASLGPSSFAPNPPNDAGE